MIVSNIYFVIDKNEYYSLTIYMDNNGLQNLKKMYEKLNYFDQYGGSVILFIIITIILIVLISYCLVMINSQPIIDDWPNQRCKPNIIPFAGFITHPNDTTALEYTQQNFNYCVQNILSSITGIAVEPLTFVTNLLQSMADQIKESIQAIRGMIDKVRTMFQKITQEIMGRIINITIPLQQIVITFKDIMSKVQGTMTAGLYTLLGSYYTLNSLMGAIAQFIVIILIALAVMIAAFWIFPFTWGAAIANTVIFIAISIPMIIILQFMTDVLKVGTQYKIPKIKCFDKDTMIKMNDGNHKKISEIEVGDLLFDNNEVTACIKVITEGSEMYMLDNIIVSDSHIVKHPTENKWIPVSKHPNSIKCTSYREPHLYCLNTTNKTININGHIFTDWDEIYNNNDINDVINNTHKSIKERYEIHKYLDGGFEGKSTVKLLNGQYKKIKDVKVNDILENGEIVYGTVIINGNNLSGQYEFNLGKSNLIGGPNLCICDKNINYITTLNCINKIKLSKNHNKLYHLLTNRNTFTINNTKVYDYNTIIDIFLDKNKEKLLSMKYV